MPIAAIPVVIIGFRNPSDIVACLGALAKAPREPAFSVFICENGGKEAYEKLLATLSAEDGPCPGAPVALDVASELPGAAFLRTSRFKLDHAIDVTIGEAPENLGYAGGINAWIAPLLRQPGWPGLWVLNPDTEPTPDALAELVDYAQRYDKSIVGSRIMFVDRPNIVGSRGLSWGHWLSRTTGVDCFAPATPAPDRQDVERRIDSPHGASFYITRPCIEKIGLMDERYFLYFEDLDWGLRVKPTNGVGYAYQSVVPHAGGTTIGSSTGRASRSPLAVYLDFRNRLLFVRKNYPGWYPWTVVMVLGRSLEFLAVGSSRNFRAALSGWRAGVAGETGRPDWYLKQLAGAPAK